MDGTLHTLAINPLYHMDEGALRGSWVTGARDSSGGWELEVSGGCLCAPENALAGPTRQIPTAWQNPGRSDLAKTQEGPTRQNADRLTNINLKFVLTMCYICDIIK